MRRQLASILATVVIVAAFAGSAAAAKTKTFHFT